MCAVGHVRLFLTHSPVIYKRHISKSMVLFMSSRSSQQIFLTQG